MKATAVCHRCEKEANQIEEAIRTDEFGTLEEERLYCRPCFEAALQEGFAGYEPLDCEVCGKILTPALHDLDVDIEEGIIWFRCPDGCEDNLGVGEYLVQPEEDYPDV